MATHDPASRDLRRRVPAVEKVLARPEIRELEQRFGRPPVVEGVRSVLDSARRAAAGGDESAVSSILEDLPSQVAQHAERALAPSLIPVINATG
ncbi:MAG TPA: hypothetical protein VFM29_02975, partial [Vicinamibacteria bacterium]|nr:hypothetical protein [Vicinamibacteria bacterium]